MGKKKKHNRCLMREWPHEGNRTVLCDELIEPLKKIVFEGYKLERLPLKQFTYTGYNIGKSDRLYYPTPDERFSSRWLENEQKFKRTLLDNVLMTVFQLGVEQGRRLDWYNRQTNELLSDIIKAKTKQIQELRQELSQYDESFQEEPPIPLELEDDELIIDQVVSDVVDVQFSVKEA